MAEGGISKRMSLAICRRDANNPLQALFDRKSSPEGSSFVLVSSIRLGPGTAPLPCCDLTKQCGFVRFACRVYHVRSMHLRRAGLRSVPTWRRLGLSARTTSTPGVRIPTALRSTRTPPISNTHRADTLSTSLHRRTTQHMLRCRCSMTTSAGLVQGEFLFWQLY